MPMSLRHQAGNLRATYTSEPRAAARAGIARHSDLGLDRCTEQQRRFRAMLALHLFNAGGGQRPYANSGTSAFLTYVLSMSPRYDLLVAINDNAVSNVVGRLMPSLRLRGGVAGLRVVAAHHGHTYHLLHLPTRTRMVITNRTVFPTADQAMGFRQGGDLSDEWPNADLALREDEHDSALLAETMTPAMQHLLAGLVTRIGTKDPQQDWSLRHWTGGDMQLWGYGDRWTFQSTGRRHHRHVASALTDPVIGIRDAQATTSDDGRTIDVTVGGARLRLLD